MKKFFDYIKDFQIGLLGLFIAFAILIVSLIVSDNVSNKNITVTGSAFEIVKSDSASWVFKVEARANSKNQAYQIVKNQIPVVEKYLLANGIAKENIDLVSQNFWETYKLNPTTGYSTSEVSAYNFSQNIKVTSNDVQKIKNLSTKILELLAQGINISSDENPQYQYSKLSELKVELLAKATKYAKQRAQSMLKSNHNRTGKIRTAKMGVFQITPVDSNSVSDMGVNDLSSIEKKVTAVANVVFEIK